MRESRRSLSLTGKWKLRAEYQTVSAAQAQRVLRMNRGVREQIEVKTVGDRQKRKLWFSEEGFLDIDLPGDVSAALMQAGVIGEPLEGENSRACGWIDDAAWWLVRDFAVTEELLREDSVRLFLETVDYCADIFLNGIPCCHHESAYRPVDIDIKEYLKCGQNEIALRLTNGAEQRHSPSRQSWFCAMDYCDSDTRFYLRKPQFTYGWDWCPPVPTCGIGGRMEVITGSGAAFAYHRVDTAALEQDGTAWMEFFAAIDKTCMESAEEARLHCRIFEKAEKGAENSAPVCEWDETLYLAGGRNFYTHRFVLPQAKLWWPNGCGEASLYLLEAELVCAGRRAVLTDELVAVRTITVCQERIDEDSRRFDLVVNGQKIFCRGGNWVPADSLYLRIAPEKYRALVREAAACHFNMLRIWGGGLYEPDLFYEECTRRGILIFHDFMYCCAYYPDDEAFWKEAAAEADYQTKRLARFPCIALWTGGNEIHESVTDWFGRRPPKLWGEKIYNEILPELVRKNAPLTFYMPSSPYFGAPTPRVMRGEYPEVSADPETGKYANSVLCGDTHAWNFLRRDERNRFRYSFEPEAFDRFPARFSSEFGIHGCLPESSMRRGMGIRGREKLAFDDSRWRWHGEQEWKREYILDMIRNHAVETAGLTPEQYLFYGALVQGYIYQEMAEAIRLRRYGAGLLIWMYSDCWPETGWSVIDYYLTRKLAFYPLRRTFAPCKIIVREQGDGTVRMKIMNETEQGGTLQLAYGYIGLPEDADGTEEKGAEEERRITVRIEKHAACEHQWEGRGAAGQGFWYVRCLNDSRYETAISLRAKFRDYTFPPAHIAAGEVQTEGEDLLVPVSGDRFVPSVFVKCRDDRTRLSDNCFFLLPGETKMIRVYGSHEVPEIIAVPFTRREKGELE